MEVRFKVMNLNPTYYALSQQGVHTRHLTQGKDTEVRDQLVSKKACDRSCGYVRENRK
jgi:hypothetical protein